ncbi:unnamed protein product [Cunninghamella echinulata]
MICGHHKLHCPPTYCPETNITYVNCRSQVIDKQKQQFLNECEQLPLCYIEDCPTFFSMMKYNVTITNNDTTSHHYYGCNTGNLTHLDAYQGFTRNTDGLVRSAASSHIYKKNSKNY